jgi:site-specific DNA recombinase
MPGYFIYCRKSSEAEDRQVLSIESQTRALEELAAKLNLPVAEVLTESKSAKEPGRPVFNQMMQRLYRGQVAGIICWKLDRLARNPVDGGSVIWAIKQNGVKIVTPAQSYAREDDNILLMYIEFGMAQKYIDDLSKNVKRGLKTKIQNGWYPGIAPVGYLNETNKLTGENYLIKDPERYPLVKRMWELMLTGLYTPTRILQMANTEWGFRTRPTRKHPTAILSRSGIYKIFSRPFYCGRFEYPSGSGHWYQGKHEAMISEAEYDRIQTLLGRYGSPRPRNPGGFSFTGLIRCGACNGMVTAEEKHQLICSNCRFKFAYRHKEACPDCDTPIDKMINPRFVRYTYYHCGKSKHPSCTEKGIRAEELEKQVELFLSRIQIPVHFKDWAVKFLHELHDKEINARQHLIRAQEAAYNECLGRIGNLLKLKTSADNRNGSLLSDEEYAIERAQLLKEKAGLEMSLQNVGRALANGLFWSETALDLASTARKRFTNGDGNTKKEILAAVGSNFLLKDKILSIQALKPFLILQTILTGNSGPDERFELQNHGLPQGRNQTFCATCPRGRGDVDKVRTLRDKSRPSRYKAYHKAERAAALIYAHFTKEFGLPTKQEVPLYVPAYGHSKRKRSYRKAQRIDEGSRN